LQLTSGEKSDESEDKENDILLFSFKRYMSRQRYLTIMSALRFTQSPPPTFRDKFWQIREMVTAWNEHMRSFFSAGWAVCLDESILIWFSRLTCPGWVFCPLKLHPFGNEYHMACCGLLGILF
jgi:hypothetical protein